jgi:hypothetical protein
MSYSSYATLQDVLMRMTRLEIMLGLLIRNTQSGVVDPATRDLLLNFAGVLDSEQQLEAALQPKAEAT